MIQVDWQEFSDESFPSDSFEDKTLWVYDDEKEFVGLADWDGEDFVTSEGLCASVSHWAEIEYPLSPYHVGTDNE